MIGLRGGDGIERGEVKEGGGGGGGRGMKGEEIFRNAPDLMREREVGEAKD